jgi:hypothetical protein
VKLSDMCSELRKSISLEKVIFLLETNVFFFRVMTHLSTKSKPISLATSKHDLAGGLAGRKKIV